MWGLALTCLPDSVVPPARSASTESTLDPILLMNTCSAGSPPGPFGFACQSLSAATSCLMKEWLCDERSEEQITNEVLVG